MERDNLKAFYNGLRPEKRLTVSEWSEQHRILGTDVSSEPGRWRNSKTPYLVEIMDGLSSFSPIQEIVVMKGAQLGLSEAGFNWVGYCMDSSPAPMMMVMPTEATIKRNSKARITPMIESTPKLLEKLGGRQNTRDSKNTTLHKSFPGGILIMAGANSAAGLRSMPIRFLYLDEIDAYPDDLDGEGSPIALAEARTRTFAKKKIYKISTPTVDGVSNIQKEFHTTDQRYYFVPCPHCEHEQVLKIDNLVYEKGRYDNVKMACQGCGTLIDERYKGVMLKRGKWIPTAKENTHPKKRGYHISSLYSPPGWYSWADCAKDSDESEKDIMKHKTFVNTVLGETYKEKGEAPDWQNVYARREDYDIGLIDDAVCILTAGVDVQGDRLELEIVGSSYGMTSWSVEYLVLMGETDKPEVWAELGKILQKQFPRKDGGLMQIRFMCVDSGYRSNYVYEFCKKNDPSRVTPVKGDDNMNMMSATPRSVDITFDGKKSGSVLLRKVGSSILKNDIYGKLKLTESEDGSFPEGYCHFPQYSAHYFKGLCSEQLITKIVGGRRKYYWAKIFDRNEPLDCRNYARAAGYICGLDTLGENTQWDAVKKANVYYKQEVVIPARKREKRKSDFW